MERWAQILIGTILSSVGLYVFYLIFEKFFKNCLKGSQAKEVTNGVDRIQLRMKQVAGVGSHEDREEMEKIEAEREEKVAETRDNLRRLKSGWPIRSLEVCPRCILDISLKVKSFKRTDAELGIFVSPRGVLANTGSVNMSLAVWILSGEEKDIL